MSDWFPQVVKIEKIEKHPNADNLSIATVLVDYPVIIRTGEFQENQLAGYIPIDTVVPDTEQFHYLSPLLKEHYEENGSVKTKIVGHRYPVGSVPERYRVINAKKIRGIYSQGLLINVPDNLELNSSIVEILNLKKSEEIEEENIPNTKKGLAAKAPKGWTIPYYDIKGVRSVLYCFQPDEEIVLLEKLNGSNAAFCFDGESLVVKSRTRYLKRDEDNMWWDVAIRYDLENKLKKFPMLVFFGECIGQVKNFRYGASIVGGKLHTKLYFFDIYDPKKMQYLDYEESIRIIKEVGLDPTPELFKGKWLGKELMYPYAEGKSTIDGLTIREGWVMKPLKERYEPRLDGRWQAKLISEGYNLNK